jgi:hypothetical protein
MTDLTPEQREALKAYRDSTGASGLDSDPEERRAFPEGRVSATTRAANQAASDRMRAEEEAARVLLEAKRSLGYDSRHGWPVGVDAAEMDLRAEMTVT